MAATHPRHVLLSTLLAIVASVSVRPSATVASQPPTPVQPDPRGCHAMASAGPHGVVVFGGAASCGLTPISDLRLWAWDGARWTVLTMVPDDIGPREDALLAYDQASTRLVLYGGRRGQQVFEDTWVWNGTAWSKSPATGPGPREHSAMAYDPVRRRLVMHGGGSRGRPAPFAETCEWNGGRWQCQTTAGPGPRIGAGMTWSPAHRTVVLYGGFAGNSTFRDAWSWNGARWEQLAENGPGPTEGHVIAGGPDALWILPTEDGVTNKRPWKLAGGKWVQAGGAGPADLIGQAAVFDARRQRLVVFGGHGPNQPANSRLVWEFDRQTWTSRAGDGS